jgi:hypothetical protein
MNEKKDKGLAKGDEDGDKGQPEEQRSMLSRVVASATELTRSAFTTPNGNELNERAAAALADSGKGQIGQSSNSNSNSAWAESSKAPQQRQQTNSASAFRAGHREEHIRQSEDEFSSFLNGIDSFTPSENTGQKHFPSGGLGDDLEESWSRSQRTVTASHSPKPANVSVAEQQSRDGEDVLALLSQSGPMEETFEPSSEDENYDWGLSAEQLSQIRAATKDLFPSIEAHGTVDPDHPLNLAPNFENAYGHTPAGSESWREQWDGVLNRYTDEVWGDLLPLVKEARKEIEELGRNPSSSEQPKALRRLGAILGHLRKY